MIIPDCAWKNNDRMVEKMYRVEDKFFCGERDLFLLEARLQTVLKPDENQKISGGYRVTSVYFDDLFDTHLQDTVDGNRLREKYRIRIYNGSYDVIKLEIKYKRDNKVLKKAKSITSEQMRSLMRGECIDSDAATMEDPITLFNLAIANRGLRPKIIVEYDRSAYIYEPGNVRITLDRNIRASDQLDAFCRGERLTYECDGELNRVLEVKYDEFLPGFIAGILETGNLNQTSYSKYRICREIKGE